MMNVYNSFLHCTACLLTTRLSPPFSQERLFSGLPFLFGVFPVLLAIIVALFIQEKGPLMKKRNSGESSPVQNSVTHGSVRLSVSGNGT